MEATIALRPVYLKTFRAYRGGKLASSIQRTKSTLILSKRLMPQLLRKLHITINIRDVMFV